jgi:hypothetical protein
LPHQGGISYFHDSQPCLASRNLLALMSLDIDDERNASPDCNIRIYMKHYAITALRT